jgi:nitrate/nitrite transporter NarK
MLLPLLCAISWGSHFAKNSFPIFAGFYLVDSQLVTPTGIGILLSLSSLPATFLPVLAGFLADRYFSISVITEIFLVATIVGQVFLTISCALENYSLMCWSMFIFGCGTSSVTSLQRSMIPIYLPSNESFSIGISITVAHIAKLAGKLYVLPLSVRKSLSPSCHCWNSH